MKIIESLEEFHLFLNEFHHNTSILVPIMSDVSAHPAVNSVCALFVRVGGKKISDFLIPFKHTEAQNLPYECIEQFYSVDNEVYTPSKKTLMHLMEIGESSIDLKGLEYFCNGECLDESKFYTPYMRNFYNRYHERRNLNTIVPIMQLVKFAEDYLDYLYRHFNRGRETHEDFKFHNNVLIPACHFMESGGVKVDPELFVKYYGERVRKNIVNGLVYTEYNPYTSAGRVSNKHGGVNYAAVEKHHGTRTAYVSRHTKGAIVLIDYESFHLRLIADLIGFELPDIPVHEYLAKQYFKKDVITPDEYDEGKQITFKYLYSDQKEGSQYPFFDEVYNFIDAVWAEASDVGYYHSKKGRRIYIDNMENPSAGKLFNYILQWTETEVAMTAINSLRKLFDGKQSKVTLYTYDSVMVDYSLDDGKDLLIKMKACLSLDGKYPVRIYVGPNYQDLHNMTDKIK